MKRLVPLSPGRGRCLATPPPLLNSDRTCPKCRGGQPLYKKILRPGDTYVIKGQRMNIQVETTIHECVRCRSVVV